MTDQTTPHRRSLVALVLLFASACGPPLKPQIAPPPDENELRPREVVETELLNEALERLDNGKASSAVHSSERILASNPDHLEARILHAMALEAKGDARAAAEAWMRVERILVYHGKQRSFELQPTLYTAVVHYMKNGRRDRARLFLDELWRRFPTSDWSVKAQLVVAETELADRQFTRVEEACSDLARMLPAKNHPTLARCHELQHIAKRMLESGPDPIDSTPTWIWEHPLPQGNTLNDLWVSPKGDCFAVGDGGTILHRPSSAKTFSVIALPTRRSLRGVSGTDEKNVYAVGVMGTILHHDGKSWRVVREPSPQSSDLWAVYVSKPDRIVAVGDGGTIVELKDGTFRSSNPVQASLRGIFGTPSGKLFIVGAGGLLLTQKDGHWINLSSDSYEDLFSLWGSDEDHLFAVGNRKTVVFFDGQKAKESVVGPSHFRDVWGYGKKEAFAVGTGGAIAHFLGDSWRVENSGTLVDLRGVGGVTSKEVLAVGVGGTMLERRMGKWTLRAGGMGQDLVGIVAGPNLGEGYALGERGLFLRRNKGKWGLESLPIPGRFQDLWSDGKRLIAIGDHGLMAIREKKVWRLQTTDTPEDLLSVSGANSLLVAVGTRATILRVEGTVVTQDRPPTGLDLMGVQMFSPRSAIAVGRRGTVLRFNGKEWTEIETGVLVDLQAVWGTSTNDFFVVGNGGTILRFTGRNFIPMRSTTSQKLVDVWGSSLENVFAVSAEGSVVRFDGSAWKTENSPSSCLRALRGDPATGVLAIGCSGSILKWQPKPLD